MPPGILAQEGCPPHLQGTGFRRVPSLSMSSRSVQQRQIVPDGVRIRLISRSSDCIPPRARKLHAPVMDSIRPSLLGIHQRGRGAVTQAPSDRPTPFHRHLPSPNRRTTSPRVLHKGGIGFPKKGRNSRWDRTVLYHQAPRSALTKPFHTWVYRWKCSVFGSGEPPGRRSTVEGTPHPSPRCNVPQRPCACGCACAGCKEQQVTKRI
jgi:hypothetical protein